VRHNAEARSQGWRLRRCLEGLFTEGNKWRQEQGSKVGKGLSRVQKQRGTGNQGRDQIDTVHFLRDSHRPRTGETIRKKGGGLKNYHEQGTIGKTQSSHSKGVP